MSKTYVCNLALQAAGLSDRIEYEDEDSLERMVCFDWFDIAVQETLLFYPWRFCEQSGTLSPSQSTRPDFPYTSTVNSNCLLVRHVYDAADNKEIAEWRMSGSGTLLTKREPSLYVYTENITDPDQWPPKITKVVAMSLAVMIAPPLLRTAETLQLLKEMQVAALREAVNDEVAGLRDVVRYGRSRKFDWGKPTND